MINKIMFDISLGFSLYVIFLSFMTGACMGSFLNCIGIRRFNHISVFTRSECDYCKHPLGLLDLFPVFSFLLLKGKCRYCKKELPKTHLFYEIISGILFCLIVYKYDLSIKTIEGLLFTSVLLIISFVDIKEMIIPDEYIVIGIIIRLIFIFLNKESLINSLLGGLIISLGLLIVVLIFEKIAKKEAMGGGDIKLIFLTGLYLGPLNNFLCLFISTFIGLLYGFFLRKKDDLTFPFGPAISLAAVICYLWGNEMILAYLSLF